MAEFKVTPWEVTGKVDYNKLIKEFGTEKIDEKLLKRFKKHAGELHHFLRRKLFFSTNGAPVGEAIVYLVFYFIAVSGLALMATLKSASSCFPASTRAGPC